jgi:hypothetical protein
MSIVSAFSLSSAEMLLLRHNVLPRVELACLAAVNRSLAIHDVQIDRLAPRARPSRLDRKRGRTAA